ncbi:MAG TPA: hypothetical protein VG605_17720 [Puia sp.]|nr:hypothetical protein [Puia sp.]
MIKTAAIFSFLCALAGAPARTHAQIPIVGIISETARKIVMAIDLRVQQLQTETIGLQQAAQELQNKMQLSELTGITGWLQQQKDLYAGYYHELWQVKTVITDFQRVADMLFRQGRIAIQYKQMQTAITQDKHFSVAEAQAMTATLTGILAESINNISLLNLAVQSLVTRMADADRLRIIDQADQGILRNYGDMQEFYQRSLLLSLQRSQDENDVAAVKALYGLP